MIGLEHTFSNEFGEWHVAHLIKHAEKLPEECMLVKDFDGYYNLDSLDPERVERADLSYPILVTWDEAQLPDIIDGQHRLAKARKEKYKFITVKIIDKLPEWAKVNLQN